VRIRIGLSSDVGNANRPTIWPEIVHRAGNLDHRHDIVTVQIAHSEGQAEGQLQTDIVCNHVLCDAESVVLEKQCDDDCWEIGSFP